MKSLLAIMLYASTPARMRIAFQLMKRLVLSFETRQREPVGVVYEHSHSSEEVSPAELQTLIDFPLKP